MADFMGLSIAEPPVAANEAPLTRCVYLHPKINVQVPIHVTMMRDKYQWFRRGRAAAGTSLYPSATSETDTVNNSVRAELAFSSVDAVRKLGGRFDESRNPSMFHTPIWTAFNGLQRGERIVFQGVVLNGFMSHGGGAGYIGDDNDNMVVMPYGTHTLFNTGNEFIPSGAMVFWDFPRIRRNRTPETHFGKDTGIDPRKFVARTLPSLSNRRARDIMDLVVSDRELKLPDSIPSSIEQYVALYNVRRAAAGANEAQKSALLARLSIDVVQCLEQCKLGKCSAAAQPGQSMDVVLGYAH